MEILKCRAYDALVEWLKHRDKDMQFMHLFCKEKTVQDMSSGQYNRLSDTRVVKQEARGKAKEW